MYISNGRQGKEVAVDDDVVLGCNYRFTSGFVQRGTKGKVVSVNHERSNIVVDFDGNRGTILYRHSTWTPHISLA